MGLMWHRLMGREEGLCVVVREDWDRMGIGMGMGWEWGGWYMGWR